MKSLIYPVYSPYRAYGDLGFSLLRNERQQLTLLAFFENKTCKTSTDCRITSHGRINNCTKSKIDGAERATRITNRGAK